MTAEQHTDLGLCYFCRMAHILSYIRELYKQPPSDVKMENGHASGQDEDAPPPQTAEVMAAILTVLLQHGRLRCG